MKIDFKNTLIYVNNIRYLEKCFDYKLYVHYTYRKLNRNNTWWEVLSIECEVLNDE